MSSAAETAAGADSPDVVAESPFEEAERTGECVEVVDERDETSLTYANPDGTATMELSAVPQRVEGDDGVWVDVDNTLVLGEDRFVRPTASVVDLALPGGGADQAMVTLGQDGMRVAYTWPGSLPEPVLDGATATYPSVLPDVDLVVTVSDTGFREVLVVRSQAGAEALATHDLEFGVETDGVRLESTEEGAARLVDDREVAPNSKSRVTLVNIFEGGTRRLVESRAKQVGESWNASSLTYTYTDSGQVTSIYDGSSASPDTVLEPTDLQCFGYDGFGQLIRAWTPDPDGFTLPERGGGTGVSLAPCRGEASAGAMGGLAPYWNDYRYDDAGMRARVIAHGADGEKTTSTYDRAGGSGVPAHGVTSVQTTSGEGVSTTESYGFDATGNTVSRPAPSGGGQELVWDIEGRLASTTDTTTGVMTSYVYDADGGLLIRRTATPGGAEGASEESVLYAGETEAVVSTTTGADGGDESVVSGRRSYRLGSLLVAQRDRPADADSRWGSLRFVAGDHHQTMTVALDPEDESDPVKRYLDPFGQPRGGQALDALNNPKAIEGLTPSQIDDLARNAGFGVRAGSASAKNPATRYYLPGTNGSQGFRVLPQGVPGQPGVKSGAYLKYFGGPLHGTRVPLGMP